MNTPDSEVAMTCNHSNHSTFTPNAPNIMAHYEIYSIFPLPFPRMNNIGQFLPITESLRGQCDESQVWES